MPIPFQLRYGQIGALGPHLWGNSLQIPQPSGVKSVADIFADASSQEILLTPSFDTTQPAGDAQLTGVWPADLHRRLEALCQNPPGLFPIPSLGVLMAPIYAPRASVFGVMFDTGFKDVDQPGLPIEYRGVPREGCAVFIEAIRKERSTAAFAPQVAFTLMHELGHIFNLQHVSSPRCFLNSSQAGPASPPLSAYRFNAEDCTWLERCANDNHVQPGRIGFAAQDYFDRPGTPQKKSGLAGQLQMKLCLQSAECYRWEPIELEIHLTARQAARSAPLQVPDQIDPGYSSFVIWIEDPSGERRRYRATKHYCQTQDTLTLASGETFRRDISIFGQSGGYTFKSPGIHFISAAMLLPDGSILRAPRIELEIRPENLRTKSARSKLEQLRSLQRIAAAAFFYRSGKIQRNPRLALEELTAQAKRNHKHLASAADYALGRWLNHQASRSVSQWRQWKAKAKPHLQLSAQSGDLNPNRRYRAAEALRCIDMPPPPF